MNQNVLRNILIIASTIQTIFWIAGLVLANVTLVLLAVVITLLVIPPVYIHRNEISEMFQRDKIVEDERTQLINEKSSTIALGALIGTIIYGGLIIVSLRYIYPQFLVTGYVLLITALLGVVITFISRTYYKWRY